VDITPGFRVIVDGSEDATSRVADRLLSLKVTDEPRKGSDALELVLDDRAPHIERPRKNAELDVSLRWQSTLVDMGRFLVDEVEIEGPPDQMVIRARAANLTADKSRSSGAGLKTMRTRSWHASTLGQVLTDIGADAGVVVEVAPEVAALTVPHLDQLRESDANLIKRLATNYDCQVAFRGGVLMAVLEHSETSASGKPLPVITIPRSVARSWSVRRPERKNYTGVAVEWYDPSTATGQTLFEGSSSGAVYKHRHQYADANDAARAAKSTLARLQRATGEAELSIVGDPRILSGTHLNLVGFRDELNGRWVVKRAHHDYGGSGLTSSLKMELA